MNQTTIRYDSVIPAKAGIQALSLSLKKVWNLDPRFRGDDVVGGYMSDFPLISGFLAMSFLGSVVLADEVTLKLATLDSIPSVIQIAR